MAVAESSRNVGYLQPFLSEVGNGKAQNILLVVEEGRFISVLPKIT